MGKGISGWAGQERGDKVTTVMKLISRIRIDFTLV